MLRRGELIVAHLASTLGQLNEGSNGRLVLADLLLDCGVQREEGEALASPLPQISVLARIDEEPAAGFGQLLGRSFGERLHGGVVAGRSAQLAEADQGSHLEIKTSRLVTRVRARSTLAHVLATTSDRSKAKMLC